MWYESIYECDILIKIKKETTYFRDLGICGGQPTIKGTRALVLDILDWIEEGRFFEEILESFPSITREDIQEILAYAKKLLLAMQLVVQSLMKYFLNKKSTK